MERLARLYLAVCGVLLAVTAGLKVFMALGEQPITMLQGADPVIGFLTGRQMLIAAAGVEVAVVCFLTRTSKLRSGLASLIWLSALFGIYRTGLFLLRHSLTCNCMGIAAVWLPGHAATTGLLSTLLLLFFSIPSALLLWGLPKSQAEVRRQFAPSLTGTRLLGLVACLLGSVAAGRADPAPPCYEVDGELLSFNPSGVPYGTNSVYRFSVTSCGNKWTIELTPKDVKVSQPPGWSDQPGQPRYVIPEYERVGCDGKNIYSIVPSSHKNSKPEPSPGAAYANSSGEIFEGPAPYFLERKLLLLWYAYASSDYLLKAPSGGKLFPIGKLPMEEYTGAKDFKWSSSWRLSAEPPHLPAFIQQSNHVSFPQQFPSGYLPLRIPNTNVLYKVLEETNDGAVTVPLVSKADFYLITYHEGRLITPLQESIELHSVRVFRSTAPPDFRPNLPVPAALSDLRGMRKAPPLVVGTYATARGWPSFDLLDSRAQRLMEIHRTSSIVSRFFSIGVILFALAGPVAYLLISRTQNNKTND
ncbi:MAG TPA: hypothetical protein VG146_18860 [Verrucomicrobiae bacterium]|nr:hypothetical protein [Verrucomicrobiae bacterium]